MIPITGKPNTLAPSGIYPFGDILDDDGTGDGTPVNRLVYADFHQFFSKLMFDAGITPNGLPENSYFSNQLNLALAAFAKKTIAVPSSWVPITLKNSWTNLHGTFKYRVDALGKINLSGIIQAPSSGANNIFADTPAILAALPCLSGGVVLSFPITQQITGLGSGTYLSISNSTMNFNDSAGSTVGSSATGAIHGISFWPDENT